ncbi:hypothetical protein [Delftia sp. DT-2]|uniref:hypothetical protein n=1 Tax=Delftia sp. DT-2 TaxID=3022772 RepID=UPI00233E8A89|nr:hypothetical protein [Delftia sp. DT-2]MDC2861670.1 hypothetical protein [Delftia sp. DT-2]
MTMAKSNPPQRPAAAVTSATDVAKDTTDTTGQLQQNGQSTADSVAGTGQVTAAETGAGSAGNAAGSGDNAQLLPAGASDQLAQLQPDQVQGGDSMRAYIVGSVPIRHNGEYFGLGERIELTESDAFRLGGLVTLASPDTKE